MAELAIVNRPPSSSQAIQPTHAQSPVLPWEVIECVIDHCSGDRATLCALRLICLQLRTRSTLVLHQEIDLQGVDLYKLEDALEARPDLQPFVRSLSCPWWLFPDLTPLFPIFPALRQFELVGHYDTFSENEIEPGLALACPSLRSLTITRLDFHAESFLDFISAFPNIEHFTSVQCGGSITESESLPLRLRTLKLLHGTDTCLSDVMFMMTRLKSYENREYNGEDIKTSLTWWIDVRELECSIESFQTLNQAAMSDITIVVWNSNIAYLRKDFYHHPNRAKLCATLEECLLRHPVHRIRMSLPDRQVLRARKTISWLDELRACTNGLSDKWGLTDSISYSGIVGHDSQLQELVVAPGGRWVATSSLDGTVILWDAHAGCIAHEWFGGPSIAFSPDGQRIAATDGYREAKKLCIWDIAADGSTTQAGVISLSASIQALAWSSSNCIALREGACVRLYDGTSSQPRLLDNIPSRSAPTFSPDGRLLVLETEEGLYIRQHVSGMFVETVKIPCPPRPPYPQAPLVAFSPDSACVAVCHTLERVLVWDMRAGADPLSIAPGTPYVDFMAFSPDGAQLLLLLSAPEISDLSLGIWDVRTGAVVRVLCQFEGELHMARFSPCGRYVAAANGDKTVTVWRTRDGSCLGTIAQYDTAVTHVAFTPDGILWSAAKDGAVLRHWLHDSTAGI